VSRLVKKICSTLIAVLSLGLVASLVGTSCSAVSPSALTVGSWSLSNQDFTTQLTAFADTYAKANGSAADLHGPDGSSWATSFTAAFLNDQLSLQLAQIDAAQRGIEITDADRAAAQKLLEQNFSSSQGGSYFGDLDPGYQKSLIEGLAAQSALAAVLQTEGTSDEALRRLYDASGDKYKGEQVCVSHILIFAGTAQGQTNPTEAEYAQSLAKITQIQSQLKGTSNFADLAKANSDDSGSGANGGDLGCNPRGAFVSEFDDAAWNQPIGVVGKPVKTKYGYHLILVRVRGELSFDSVKEDLAASLKSNLSGLLEAELANVAAGVQIGVDGRYGQFVATSGSIAAPAGASSPSTIARPISELAGSTQG
jgi:parvulin-like peptidyl-prolyl isomerase